MNENRVRELIQEAIREHELRVAAVSGAMGALLLAGTWHALWLLGNH